MWSQEVDSTIIVGPFQLDVFYCSMNSVGRKCCAIEYFVSNTAESLLASNNFLDMQVGIVYY